MTICRTRREACSIALSALGLAGAATILPARAAHAATGSGTLTVGVRDNIPGFGELNKQNGKFYGLEVDIAQEMATRMGYSDITCKAVTPDNRRKKLQSGKVDCIVACYSANDTRKKNFDFSPTYYTDHIVLMAQNSSLVSCVDDLKGLTIGTRLGADTAAYVVQNLTERGFTSGQAVQANADNSDVTYDTWRLRQYTTYPELSNALERGEIDAFAADGAIANGYLTSSRTLLGDYEAAPQEYAVATQKGSKLSKQVSSAIQEMLDDGTIADLIEKWN